LEEKHKNLTLDKISCPHCNSKSVNNGNFITKAKYENRSNEEILKICHFYDRMSLNLNQLPSILAELDLKFGYITG
jgi:hypothetical protein